MDCGSSWPLIDSNRQSNNQTLPLAHLLPSSSKKAQTKTKKNNQKNNKKVQNYLFNSNSLAKPFSAHSKH